MIKFPESRDDLIPAGVLRRLAAMLYDFILCLALVMVTTMIYMLLAHTILGAETYKAINDSGQSMRDPFLQSTLFISLFLFFGYFWTRNGQTLGMQVWHIRVQNKDNTAITWRQALMRFMMAIVSWLALGLGHLWPFFDDKKRSWHCMFSNTEIVRIPKYQKKD